MQYCLAQGLATCTEFWEANHALGKAPPAACSTYLFQGLGESSKLRALLEWILSSGQEANASPMSAGSKQPDPSAAVKEQEHCAVNNLTSDRVSVRSV